MPQGATKDLIKLVVAMEPCLFAGRRVVSFPDLIAPDLSTHLEQLAPAPALVFTSPDGQPLRHSNFYRRVWMPASASIGLVGTHLHDLRHTGNQFIATRARILVS
jgi:integrase